MKKFFTGLMVVLWLAVGSANVAKGSLISDYLMLSIGVLCLAFAVVRMRDLILLDIEERTNKDEVV